MSVNQKILSYYANSEQKLVDVIGYFENSEESSTECVLCAMGFIFEESKFYIVVQEDDSFVLYANDWCSDPKWKSISFMKRRPWSLAIGNPLLWSWVLHNQQGYFDGIQLEFAKSTESRSVIVQLVALGSEIKQRDIAEKCSAITFTQ
ncbi:DUF6334 family protein [Hahella sp. NBU794]|uniref:DUF6334 family protein n=1 Tax=Hahella sp. NBU794 TaxID=3422590 RepID=UPI003D6DFAFA